MLFIGSWWDAFQRVQHANEAQQLGAAAFSRRDYRAAAAAFARARELGSRSAQLQLDLGHAYAQSGQSAAAREAYGQVLTNASAALRSLARQQLAVLAATEGNYPQAVALLRQALTDNPANAVARYNYELLSPLLGRRQPPQLPPPPPPPGQGQQNRPKSGNQPQQKPQTAPDASGTTDAPAGGGKAPGQGTSQEMAQGTAGGTTRGLDAGSSGTAPGKAPSAEAATAEDNRLGTRQREPAGNLNEAQARQVLDALQAAEQQYLQQLPHRATRRADPRKPAW
ncbi:hypothetical protein [Hymenobacter jeollabukensis]|uniref:Uncharacterized protein n=1 Tax=Hymenobacter jeollabukensis TaxID=2025313 RepID=A0A5R8WWD8_9BACT|nr:hypothetical protein [Hymenobacter jeollabukensis]TLM96786.1 hypothetical protein FDY95_01990 [Hymenobacter jeollabukensis]